MLPHTTTGCNRKVNAGIEVVTIPAAAGGTGSRYDQYLDAAMKALKPKAGEIQGVPVPNLSTAASTVANLNQIIRRRKLPVRVIRRGSQVYVARRESK